MNLAVFLASGMWQAPPGQPTNEWYKGVSVRYMHEVGLRKTVGYIAAVVQLLLLLVWYLWRQHCLPCSTPRWAAGNACM